MALNHRYETIIAVTRFGSGQDSGANPDASGITLTLTSGTTINMTGVIERFGKDIEVGDRILIDQDSADYYQAFGNADTMVTCVVLRLPLIVTVFGVSTNYITYAAQ